MFVVGKRVTKVAPILFLITLVVAVRYAESQQHGLLPCCPRLKVVELTLNPPDPTAIRSAGSQKPVSTASAADALAGSSGDPSAALPPAASKSDAPDDARARIEKIVADAISEAWVSDAKPRVQDRKLAVDPACESIRAKIQPWKYENKGLYWEKQGPLEESFIARAAYDFGLLPNTYWDYRSGQSVPVTERLVVLHLGTYDDRDLARGWSVTVGTAGYDPGVLCDNGEFVSSDLIQALYAQSIEFVLTVDPMYLGNWEARLNPIRDILRVQFGLVADTGDLGADILTAISQNRETFRNCSVCWEPTNATEVFGGGAAAVGASPILGAGLAVMALLYN